MATLRPALTARLMMLTAPVGLLTGTGIIMVIGSGPSWGYVTLAAVAVAWSSRCFRVRVEWNEEGLHAVNYLRSYNIAWAHVEDIVVGHTSNIIVRGIPFAVPKLRLVDGRTVRLLGALGVSRDAMIGFLDDVERLTAGRGQGTKAFRSYSPWCKPSALTEQPRHEEDS